MVGETDERDKKESRKIAILILSLFVVLVVVILLVLPAMSSLVATQFAPGDGFLGEIPYMLPAFLTFFLISWLF